MFNLFKALRNTLLRSTKNSSPFMANHTVKIIDAEFITPDVKRFIIEKPSGYNFVPGQATEVAVNKEGWSAQFRPFTFTGLRNAQHLELITRIYNSRHGVTEQLGKTNAGAELIIQEPFGAIEYKGLGVFIAGGTGITPFLSIFRNLSHQKQLTGCRLIYSNYGAQDIICGPELQEMLKENLVNHFTREGVIGFKEKRLNRDQLVKYIADFSQRFYICGSESFVKDIAALLLELGAPSDGLVIDK